MVAVVSPRFRSIAHIAGGLWVAFGQAFELLGGAAFAIAGVSAILLSVASDSNVPADTARELAEMWADGE